MAQSSREFGVLYLAASTTRASDAHVAGPFATAAEAHVAGVSRCQRDGGDYMLMVRAEPDGPWRSTRGETPREVLRRRRREAVVRSERTWTSSGRGVAWDWWRRRADGPQ
ncbi:hypothetical protein OMK64_13155 [Cellulomonas fimi]|uniref:hypothetical protein n=1 Tax=Cellulomonas fimi TaxID=1708 RepID=UPI00234E08C6|nr:hypothetical protein [Cellulomonas fimi]MDC7122482.1 hypothetical protein [Cellulomonas fimi]